MRDSKKGDVALLHYSGHGSNVPDDNSDEADGRDEILCPADLDWDDPLRDDWLRTTLRRPARGRQPHRHHGLLPFGDQHARHPAARCAGEGALPAEPLGLKAVESGRSVPKKVTSELRALARARRARPRTSSTRSCPKCSSPGAATPRRRPTPSSTAGTTARSRLRWSRRFARARAASPIESCTTAPRACSRPGSSSRCRSSKAGRRRVRSTPAVLRAAGDVIMSRPDQSITFLRGHGFSVFRFPRASAQPLELMHREGKDLTRLGMVPDLVTAGAVAAPDVRRDASPGIDIEGKETSKVNVAIGSEHSRFVHRRARRRQAGARRRLQQGADGHLPVHRCDGGRRRRPGARKIRQGRPDQPAHSVRDAGEAARRRGLCRDLGAEDQKIVVTARAKAAPR